jgi:hypothetical protein
VSGGGIAIDGSAFDQNHSGHGGGACVDADTSVVDSTFDANQADWEGGGLFLDTGTGDVTGDTFTNNVSQHEGGGIYAYFPAQRFADDQFVGNSAVHDDAGAARIFHGTSTFEDDTFEGNTTGASGGAMKMSHQGNEVRRCVFRNNTAGNLGGALEIDDDSTHIADSTFEGNEARRGGAIHYNSVCWGPTLEGSTFTDNTASSCGGAVAFTNDDPVRDRLPYSLTATHLRMDGNHGGGKGGGMCVTWSGVDLSNSIVTGNDANAAGGLYIDAQMAHLRNLVVSGNDASRGAAMQFVAIGDFEVTNSVVVSNTGGEAVDVTGSAPLWQYDDVWSNAAGDWSGASPELGQGNVAANPIFRGEDYRLGAGSPLIDAGDPVSTDPDGSRSDIGAYGGPGGSW